MENQDQEDKPREGELELGIGLLTASAVASCLAAVLTCGVTYTYHNGNWRGYLLAVGLALVGIGSCVFRTLLLNCITPESGSPQASSHDDS